MNNLTIYDNRISIKELAEPQYVKIFCKIKILVHVHLLIIIGLLDQPDSDFENILYKFFQKTFFSEIYPWQRKPNQCGFRSPGALRVYVEPLCLNIDTGDVRTRPCVVRCVYNYTLQQCSEPVLKLNLLHELTTTNSNF